MPSTFPPRLGDRVVDRYELAVPLRVGAVTQTFLALDEVTGQDVAVTLFDPASVTPVAWAEFGRVVAAALAAKVPGLVLPHTIPKDLTGSFCCVADLPIDRGFDRLHEQGPMAWQRALALGDRIVEILSNLYKATRTPHHALTPVRCLVSSRDEVKLLDYGVAEIERTNVGDPGYRAPEFLSPSADPRPDIFSVGAILYELISGHLPHPSQRLSKVLNVPLAVDELLARALAPNPRQRYQDFLSFRANLREVLGLPLIHPGASRTIPPIPFEELMAARTGGRLAALSEPLEKASNRTGRSRPLDASALIDSTLELPSAKLSSTPAERTLALPSSPSVEPSTEVLPQISVPAAALASRKPIHPTELSTERSPLPIPIPEDELGTTTFKQIGRQLRTGSPSERGSKRLSAASDAERTQVFSPSGLVLVVAPHSGVPEHEPVDKTEQVALPRSLAPKGRPVVAAKSPVDPLARPGPLRVPVDARVAHGTAWSDDITIAAMPVLNPEVPAAQSDLVQVQRSSSPSVSLRLRVSLAVIAIALLGLLVVVIIAWRPQGI